MLTPHVFQSFNIIFNECIKHGDFFIYMFIISSLKIFIIGNLSIILYTTYKSFHSYARIYFDVIFN
jgi:hypothetical protein